MIARAQRWGWLACMIGALLVAPAGARAAGIPPTIEQAFRAANIPETIWGECYQTLVRGLGNGVRVYTGKMFGPDQVREVGEILIENNEAVMKHAIQTIKDVESLLSSPVRTSVERGLQVLQQGQVHRPIVAELNKDFIAELAEAAYQTTTSASGQAVRRVIVTEGGGVSRGFLARLASRLGPLVEWLASKTAMRLFGAYTIASFTAEQIDAALIEFEEQMESVGDAFEAEAYNNNLRLLLEHLKDGRQRLKDGVTLAQAIRAVRHNMVRGGAVFTNILVPGEAPRTPHPEAFRLSGGIDTKFKTVLQEKVARTGATLLLEGSNMTFTFVSNSSDVRGSTGSLEMSPSTITHTWQFTYRTGMIDRRDTSCELKKGHYNVLSPNEPMKMIGAWGGALTCRTKATRDGKLMSDTSSDTVMMINYDKDAREWIVIVVGVQDGQWRLH